MVYICFSVKSNFKKQEFYAKHNCWNRIGGLVSNFLCKILPRTNPDYSSGIIDAVEYWYVEYDEEKGLTCREIGLNAEKQLIFKAPYKKNLGFWCDEDLSLDDYSKFCYKHISKSEFESLWEKKIGTSIPLILGE